MIALIPQYSFRTKTASPIDGRLAHGQIHIILSDRLELGRRFLATLAFKKPKDGHIRWNEHDRSECWISRIGIVPKHDTLAGHLTVREHLIRSARLRLWSRMDSQERTRFIDETIEFFGFQVMQNHRVRPDGIDLLSPCDRQLLQLSIEIVGDPEILFIEEPVDELIFDQDIIRYYRILSRLAHERGISIVLLVCNPRLLKHASADSASVFLEGKLVYFGNYSDLLANVFPTMGDENRDFLDLIIKEPRSRKDLERRRHLIDSFPPLVVATSNNTSDAVYTCDRPVYKRPCPWGMNAAVLAGVRLRDNLRNKRLVFTMITSFVVVYLLLSFVFFQMPLNPEGLFDRSGLLYFLSFNLLLTSSLPILVLFEDELAKIQSELQVNLVCPSSFVFSQFLAALPLRCLLVILLGTVLYYITGLRTDGFQHVIVFIAVLLLTTWVSIALGIFVAATVIRLEYSQIVLPFLAVIFFVYGNLSFAPDATWILRWIQYLSPMYYSFQCLIQNELDNPSIATTLDGTNITDFLSSHSYDKMPIAACLPALFGFTVVYLVLACIAVRLRIKTYHF